jgi:hypothetical protein
MDVALLLASGVTEVGFKLHPTVDCTGEIVQLRLTAALKPLTEFTVMVEVVDPPGSAFPDTGPALNPKSGAERVVA